MSPARKTSGKAAADHRPSPRSRNDVSPETYLAELQHPLKPEALELRSIILGAVPELKERIKWNAPSYLFEGDDRITFNFFAQDKIRLVFHCGAKTHKRKGKGRLVADPDGLLEWASDHRAVASFGSMAEIRARRASLTALISAWLAAAR